MDGGRAGAGRLLAAAPLVLLVALLASCGGDDSKPPAPGATPRATRPNATPTTALSAFPGDTWQLEYGVNGGFIGRSERLVLDQTGKTATEDKRAGRTASSLVAAPDLAQLVTLMRAANLPALKSDQGFPCADCIVTSIKVTSGGQSYGGTFINDANVPAEVAPLLRRLAAFYEANRP